MGDDRGPKIRARWARARQVAEALDIGVKAAWISLNTLDANGLIEPVIEGIEEAISIAREHIAEPKNRDFKANAQDVKLMLWAFDKIGDLERIKIAYQKAMKVIE